MGADRPGRRPARGDLSAQHPASPAGAAYADVVLVDPALSHLDRSFTYAMPDPVPVGAVVKVPFRGRQRTGVVTAHPDAPDLERVLDIGARAGPGLPPDAVALARWLSARYLSTLGEALATVLPKRVVAEEAEPFPPAPARAPAPSLDWLDILTGGARLSSALADGPPSTFVLRPPAGRARAAAVADLVAAGAARGGVLVLVPEVRFAGALAGALDERFGEGIAHLGSDRTHRARYRAWLGLRTGALRIALGGRGAVFAPVPDLALIVIDDEGHASYKEGRAPRYHARAVAAERARAAGAGLVLVGVPPSLEARAAVARGHAVLVEPARAAERTSRPPVQVVVRGPGERLVPSAGSLKVATGVLAGGGRVVLILHRGGEVAAAAAERAERILRPARAARLDASATAREIRSAAARADLIVASPVIAKDLSLEGIGLIVLAEVDAALVQPSFRAAEEAFATWWRVAPWIGEGRVVVETADPSHPAIVSLTRWDPAVLARAEEERRRELRYPPFASMARIDVPADRAMDVVEALTAAQPPVDVLGPVESDGATVVAARADRRDDLLAALAPLVRRWRDADEPMRVDVDPWEVLVRRWRS